MFNMSNNTLKNEGQSNFGQSGNSERPDKVTNFLLFTGVEQLDDAASAAVNGGWSGGVGDQEKNQDAEGCIRQTIKYST